jgi:hypothetical protein
MLERANAHTPCGKGFEACPMVPAVGLVASIAQFVSDGAIDRLHGGSGSDPPNRRWVFARRAASAAMPMTMVLIHA